MGGKERLGGISKLGDRYLRRLLVIGATAVVRHARQHPQKNLWVMRLLAKKPAKLIAVAVANKMARIAWAIMAKGGYYRAPELAAAAWLIYFINHISRSISVNHIVDRTARETELVIDELIPYPRGPFQLPDRDEASLAEHDTSTLNSACRPTARST